MVITQVQRVGADLSSFAQHRLRLYRNPSFTAEQIIRRHSLPPKYHSAAKNQAAEVRACLCQAQEYFDAARAVSPATRPLQLYYGLMSLALACVLVKQDANSRLRRLRERHNSHGLSLALDGDVSRSVGTADIATRLRSVPQVKSGGAFGTFEVWRQSARELPAPVEVHQHRGAGTTTVLTAELIGQDLPPNALPSTGCTLLRALQAIPSIQRELIAAGLQAGLVRARMRVNEDAARSGSVSFIVQPAAPELIASFAERMKFDLSAAQQVQVVDVFDSGFGIHMPTFNGQISGRVQLPQFLYASGEDLHFAATDWDLGEFGAYYLGLHMTGNLVRYFPDVWVPHVEHATSFAELVHAMCVTALDRLPILVASELDGYMYF